jgi:hypothetical protein
MRNQVAVVIMNSTMTALTRRLSVYFSIPPPQRVPEEGPASQRKTEPLST